MSGRKLVAVVLAALSSIVLTFVLIVVGASGHVPSGGIEEPVTVHTPRELEEDPLPTVTSEPTCTFGPLSCPGCPNCVW
jgi:hypothetical protein